MCSRCRGGGGGGREAESGDRDIVGLAEVRDCVQYVHDGAEDACDLRVLVDVNQTVRYCRIPQMHCR